MYSDTFLTACPICQSVFPILRYFLNKKIPCTECTLEFVARENFIDVEDSPHREAFVSQPTTPAGERGVLCKLEPDGDAQGDKVQHECTLNDQRGAGMDGHEVLEETRHMEGLELLAQRKHVVGGETASMPLKVATKGAPIEWELVMEDNGEHNVRLVEDDKIAEDYRLLEDEGWHDDRRTEDDGWYDDRLLEDDGMLQADGQLNDRLIEDNGEQNSEDFTDCSKGMKTSAKLSETERQGRTKVGKRKFGQSLVWGVALRKPLRERRTVRSYSPSREWTRKRVERLGKGKKLHSPNPQKRSERKMKKQQEMKNWRDTDIPVEKESVGKGSDGLEHNVAEEDSDGAASEEVKAFLTQEIKRQVLDGLGEMSKQALGDIHVVKVEGIHPCNLKANGDDASAEEPRYVAKVKLMASLFFPVTLRANESLSTEHKEHSHQAELPCKDMETLKAQEIKEGEDGKDRSAKFMEDMKDERRKGLMNCIKPSTKEYMEPSPAREGYAEPPSMTRGYMEPSLVQEQPMEPPPPSLADDLGWAEEREADVLQSELYDFGCDCNEDNFSPGQVWASYDCKDGMPRDYVQIRKVVSKDPFIVHIVLLEPRGFVDWAKAGNTLTCGEFSTDIRKVAVMKDVDVFSHQVQWERGPGGVIVIYPTEGEVWALYKNFRERDPSKRIKSGYEIVQVVSFTRAERTASVVNLVRCKGSRTLFVREEIEPIEICKDFTRFSHQIPGFEALDGEGRIELDPAATPHEWIY